MPEDATTLATLYSRLGQKEKALACVDAILRSRLAEENEYGKIAIIRKAATLRARLGDTNATETLDLLPDECEFRDEISSELILALAQITSAQKETNESDRGFERALQATEMIAKWKIKAETITKLASHLHFRSPIAAKLLRQARTLVPNGS